jgi:hypothetical protein
MQAKDAVGLTVGTHVPRSAPGLSPRPRARGRPLTWSFCGWSFGNRCLSAKFWRLKGKWERGHHSKGRREGPQQASEGPDESEGEPGAHLGGLTRASELMVLSCLFRDDLSGVYRAYPPA